LASVEWRTQVAGTSWMLAWRHLRPQAELHKKHVSCTEVAHLGLEL
jgi:hypothetical protein